MPRPSNNGAGKGFRNRPYGAASDPTSKSLISNIINYWVSQGYPPETIKVEVGRDSDLEIYTLRSNLRNGSPPGTPVAAVRGRPA